ILLTTNRISQPDHNKLLPGTEEKQLSRININAGYESQKCGNVVAARETVAYHREKMLLCKQEEARIQLNVEQADWKDDTDDESDDQELEAHYMYMAKV
nr:hypothetical protein [Tanacetum cinerariifolium]